MDGRRRHSNRGYFNDQEVPGRRSNNRKPPLGTWQPMVPAWEKRFCTSVGSVPWSKLLEAKRSMYLFENVVRWKDSACEEAFNNAKKRYWAEINGLPCDISLPDPDIYIDEIDWNCDVDPELILDLERPPDTAEEAGMDEKGMILNTTLLSNQQFSCIGWGDKPEFEKDIGLDCTQNAGNDANSWEQDRAPCNGTGKDDRWGSYFNDSWGCNNQWGSNYDQSNNSWDNNYNQRDASYNEVSNVDYRRGGGDWGTWNLGSQKREGSGWYMSRYKTSRFPGNEYQMDREWKNRRGWKRSNIACR